MTGSAGDVALLVVDDRQFDADDTQEILAEELGVKLPIYHAKTDAEAIAMVSRYHPSVVFLDYRLEGSTMDGDGLAAVISDMNGFMVCMLSTSVMREQVDAAFAGGAMAWIEKGSYDLMVPRLEAAVHVFIEGNYCPKDWVDRFVRIHPDLVEP